MFMDKGFINFLRLVRDRIGSIPYGVAMILVAVIVALIVQKLAEKLIHSSITGTTVGELSIFVNIVRAIIWGLAIAVVGETVFNIKLDSVFAALGIGSLVLSLGLQDLIKNVVSGIGIITFKIFGVGDQIVVGEHRGEVMDITWRQTVIRDIDGDPHVIPNSLVNTQIVTRRDGELALRHETTVEVRPGLDLEVVGAELERVALEALTKAGIRKGTEPAPKVRFLSATAYGVQASVRIFVDDIELRTPAFDCVMRAFSQTGYLSDCTNETAVA